VNVAPIEGEPDDRRGGGVVGVGVVTMTSTPKPTRRCNRGGSAGGIPLDFLDFPSNDSHGTPVVSRGTAVRLTVAYSRP
jgi:hypothetical protein